MAVEIVASQSERSPAIPATFIREGDCLIFTIVWHVDEIPLKIVNEGEMISASRGVIHLSFEQCRVREWSRGCSRESVT